MRITLEEIEEAFKEIFDDSELLYSESSYEAIQNKESVIKLVLSFNKLYTDETFNIIYTKMIFLVDSKKTHLLKNKCLYLYDINNEYSNIDFEDIDDFKEKIKNIFKNKKFGHDLKILSQFLKHPSVVLNKWMVDNSSDGDEISFLNIEFIPINSTNKQLIFNFKISLSNVGEVGVSITKRDKLYDYNFKFENNVVKIERNSLNDLVETIAKTIKNNIN